MMKKNIFMSLMMAMMSVISFGLMSCSSDDDEKTEAPVIVIDEANIEGDELCVEGSVVAKGRTASILLEITDAAGTTMKVAKSVTDAKYINVLNIDEFHVHLDIAGKNIEVNDVLKFTVTDAKGQTTTAKKPVTEDEDEDEDAHHDHD